jgi:two-component system OmpR family response regulator
MKILIIEDNVEIADQLADHLKSSGFISHIENDGESGFFEGSEGGYDLVLLDVGLPGMDGFSILEKWRADGNSIPVIMITARDSKMDVVRGLELGGDDYVTKPFDLDEVVARIRSNIKRESGKTSNVITSGKAELDVRGGRVLVDGKHIKLTRIEFLMVQYLFMNQGRPITTNELVEHTYEDFDNDSGIIARHIANIRKKIGRDVIKTEANRGYYVPHDNEA